MTEPHEVAADAATPEAPVTTPRRRPTGWLVLTGLLVLLSLATWVYYGKIKTVRLAREAVVTTGRTAVRALGMVNPDVLAPEGNNKAQTLFKELVADPHIAYVILQDENGQVRAASNTIFMDKTLDTLPDVVTGNTVQDKAADIEVGGPIKNPDGAQIGSVRVGLSFTPRGE